MAKTRRSATVLLTQRGTSGEEVYLVERAPELRFFGGYLALPGGVIDIEAGTSTEEQVLDCAHRELFEETGVLVPELATLATDRSPLRQELLDGNATRWKELVGTTPSPELHEIGGITTPPFAPVRYETTFYHLSIPEGEAPEIWPGELVGGRFWNPHEALERWRHGDLLIVPPVLFLLELLAEEGALTPFLVRATVETGALSAGRLHPVRFSPGVFMAALETATKPPATTTNAFIVGEEHLYVVDPGSTDVAEQERLAERIDAALAAGGALEGVLLTHYHPDHTGGFEAVCRRYGVPLMAHQQTLERLSVTDVSTRVISEGTRLALGTAPDGSTDWSLEVLETPGHSPDHLAFIESRYRAAIVGDLVSTLSTVVIDPSEGHMRTYLNSLEKVKAASIQTIYPGHGPALKDGSALLSRTIAHRGKRERKLVSALSEAPQSADSLLARVYDDVDPRVHHLARQSLHSGLIKLLEDGRAHETPAGWSV